MIEKKNRNENRYFRKKEQIHSMDFLCLIWWEKKWRRRRQWRWLTISSNPEYLFKKRLCVCVFQARKKKNIVVLRKEGERRRGEKNSSCKYIDAFGSWKLSRKRCLF